MEDKKRLTARKSRIVDIVSGNFFPGSKEDMKSSYVITPFGQKISRINLVATVIDKFLSEDGNYSSITVDDGTEAIRVKAFKEDVEMMKNIEPGNLILAIGKVKAYNNEVYVNGEIVRKVEPNFETLRKVEILKELAGQKKNVDEIKKLIDQMSEEELKEYVQNKFGMDEETLQVVRENLNVVKEIDYKPKILELIESLDEGSGVEISKILEISNLPENVIENAINELMGSGFLYEPKVGVLKKV
jgi:RPA family protein